MRAIIIGGFPEYIGRVITAVSFGMHEMADGTPVESFRADPDIIHNARPLVFLRPHLSFLPPEEDVVAHDQRLAHRDVQLQS